MPLYSPKPPYISSYRNMLLFIFLLQHPQKQTSCIINALTISGLLFFVLQIIRTVFQLNPPTILTFISSYAVPVLLCKQLLFWRHIKVIIGEDHMTSTMIQAMKFPWLQRLGVRHLYPKAHIIIVPTNAIKKILSNTFLFPKKKSS